MIDASQRAPQWYRVAAGEYAVERVPNPLGYTAHPWLVLKGTAIGAPESLWHSWTDRSWGDFQAELNQDEEH